MGALRLARPSALTSPCCKGGFSELSRLPSTVHAPLRGHPLSPCAADTDHPVCAAHPLHIRKHPPASLVYFLQNSSETGIS
jgi:hypothetical protein